MPCGEMECEGGGSQTCVTPALAMSSTWALRLLYQPPCFLYDSQLNPWKRTCAWTRLQRATRKKSRHKLLECFICLSVSASSLI